MIVASSVDNSVMSHRPDRTSRKVEMQIFIPLTVPDLQLSRPPKREVFEVDLRPDAENIEEVAEEVRDTAALASLEEARDEEAPATRLVASAFVEKAGDYPSSWDQVDALYVDDEMGRDLAEKAVNATTQDEADSAVEALLEEPLMWADVSERPRLHAFLVGEGDW